MTFPRETFTRTLPGRAARARLAEHASARRGLWHEDEDDIRLEHCRERSERNAMRLRELPGRERVVDTGPRCETHARARQAYERRDRTRSCRHACPSTQLRRSPARTVPRPGGRSARAQSSAERAPRRSAGRSTRDRAPIPPSATTSRSTCRPPAHRGRVPPRDRADSEAVTLELTELASVSCGSTEMSSLTKGAPWQTTSTSRPDAKSPDFDSAAGGRAPGRMLTQSPREGSQ